MRRDPFQKFHQFEGGAPAVPLIELNQSDNPVVHTDRHQGHGGVTMMNAFARRMYRGANLLIQKQQRIVGPEASPRSKERVGRICAAVNDLDAVSSRAGT